MIVFGESGKGFNRNTLQNDAHLGGIVDLVVEKVSEGHGAVAGERLPIECELTVLFANEAFYRAFADRDMDAMEDLWAASAPASSTTNT